MTEAIAAAPRPRRWRSRLPLILLALSLALNFFFIGGAFWLKSQALRAQMTPPERARLVARQLSLDDNQRAAFDEFIKTARQRTRELREANKPLIEQAWGELAKANPDEALLDRLAGASADNRRRYQVDLAHALRGFLATLSDEQRRTFVDLLRQRQNRNMPPFMRQLVE
ncbi:MAG: hypothetical protein JWL84_700 [Rhodospirillales bacterium]|nr:hypothetical protein [Rhodospirillales bacterium]